MPWEAIKYVSSGITLLAFIAAVVLAIYRRTLLSRERLIELAPPDKRAQLVKSTLQEFFDVNTDKLSEKHAYDLAIEQIRARSRRYVINALIVLTILLCSAGVTVASFIYRIPRTATAIPPQPKPAIQVKITSPGPNQTYPEKYKIPFSGNAFDPQFGSAVDQDLSWIADGGSPFGSGNSLAFGDLPLGHHRITLKAINTNGETGAASIDITVVAQGTRLKLVSTFAACPPPARAQALTAWQKSVTIACVSDTPERVGAGIRTYSLADINNVAEGPLISMPRPETLAYKDRVLFVADGSATRLWDASDPSRLKLTAAAALPMAALILNGNILVARKFASTTLYDVTNALMPKELGTFVSEMGNLGVLAGPWAGTYGTTLLLADRWQGLHVVDFSKPPTLTLEATLPGSMESGYQSNIEVVDDIAYVSCCYSQSLRSIYIHDPLHPQIVGNLDGAAGKIKYNSHRIYSAAFSNGLIVVNVDNPAKPLFDSVVYDYKYVTDVDVKDDLILLAADHDLVILQRQ